MNFEVYQNLLDAPVFLSLGLVSFALGLFARGEPMDGRGPALLYVGGVLLFLALARYSSQWGLRSATLQYNLGLVLHGPALLAVLSRAPLSSDASVVDSGLAKFGTRIRILSGGGLLVAALGLWAGPGLLVSHALLFAPALYAGVLVLLVPPLARTAVCFSWQLFPAVALALASGALRATLSTADGATLAARVFLALLYPLGCAACARDLHRAGCGRGQILWLLAPPLAFFVLVYGRLV